jgi:hypothetical protein
MLEGQLMPDPRSGRTYALIGIYINSPIASTVLYSLCYISTIS